MRHFIVLISIFLAACLLFGLGNTEIAKPQLQPQPNISVPIQPPPSKQAEKPHISRPIPPYLTYQGLVEQLRTWKKEAKDITEVKTYGKTSAGQNIYYLRINNKYSAKPKYKVLLTAAIHGNEEGGTAALMAVTGTLLSKYKTDKKITKLIDTRDICVVPSVSPDSYGRGRMIDGVDPNRNFLSPNPVAPIAAIKKFFSKEQFHAVLSGHTSGRLVLYPWGHTHQPSPDHERLVQLSQHLANLAGYRPLAMCKVYPNVIWGAEGDFYYSEGATSLVFEIGTTQGRPSPAEIQEEFRRVWPAYLYFIEHAPTYLDKF